VQKHKLEIAAQGIAQCEVSATCVVVDAALRCIGKSRRGCHKNANISGDCERIRKRISPMDSAYFSGRSGGGKIVFRIFLKLDPLCGPVVAACAWGHNRKFSCFQFWLRPQWKYFDFSTSSNQSNWKHVN